MPRQRCFPATGSTRGPIVFTGVRAVPVADGLNAVAAADGMAAVMLRYSGAAPPPVIACRMPLRMDGRGDRDGDSQGSRAAVWLRARIGRAAAEALARRFDLGCRRVHPFRPRVRPDRGLAIGCASSGDAPSRFWGGPRRQGCRRRAPRRGRVVAVVGAAVVLVAAAVTTLTVMSARHDHPPPARRRRRVVGAATVAVAAFRGCSRPVDKVGEIVGESGGTAQLPRSSTRSADALLRKTVSAPARGIQDSARSTPTAAH